jgi:hypothetical protein
MFDRDTHSGFHGHRRMGALSYVPSQYRVTRERLQNACECHECEAKGLVIGRGIFEKPLLVNNYHEFDAAPDFCKLK